MTFISNLASQIIQRIEDPSKNIEAVELLLVTAAGFFLSLVILAIAFIVRAIQDQSDAHIRVPLPDRQSLRVGVPSRAQAATEFEGLVRAINDSVNDNPETAEFAMEAVVRQLHLQARNIRGKGHFQMLTQVPVAMAEAGSGGRQITDAYGNIAEMGGPGDQVAATVFTNSSEWWLNERVARSFFEYNLNLISSGVEVRRIFGLGRSGQWEGDDTKEKVMLIDLLASICHGSTRCYVSTISYRAFETPNLPGDIGRNFQERDMLILRRRVGVEQKAIAGIEWEIIPSSGYARRVFAVVSEQSLNQLQLIFEAISASRECVPVKVDHYIDIATSRGLRDAWDKFEEIMSRSKQPGP